MEPVLEDSEAESEESEEVLLQVEQADDRPTTASAEDPDQEPPHT